MQEAIVITGTIPKCGLLPRVRVIVRLLTFGSRTLSRTRLGRVAVVSLSFRGFALVRSMAQFCRLRRKASRHRPRGPLLTSRTAPPTVYPVSNTGTGKPGQGRGLALIAITSDS